MMNKGQQYNHKTNSIPFIQNGRSLSLLKLLGTLLVILVIIVSIIYRESFIPIKSEQDVSQQKDSLHHQSSPPPPHKFSGMYLAHEAPSVLKILVLCIDSVECRKFTLFLGQLPESVVLLDIVSLPPKLLLSPRVKRLVVRNVLCQSSDLCSSYDSFKPDFTILFIQNPFTLYSQILSGQNQYNFSSKAEGSKRNQCTFLHNLFYYIDVRYGDALIRNIKIGWVAYEHFLEHENKVVEFLNDKILNKEPVHKFLPLSEVRLSLNDLLLYNRQNCLIAPKDLSSINTVPLTSPADSSDILSLKQYLLNTGTSFSWEQKISQHELIPPTDKKVGDWVEHWSPKISGLYSALANDSNPFPENFNFLEEGVPC